MMYSLISTPKPLPQINPLTAKPPKNSSFLHLRPIRCFYHHNPKNPLKSDLITLNTHLTDPSLTASKLFHPNKVKKNRGKSEDEWGSSKFSSQQLVLTLCGFGYWVQGFRGFPWLALNFHMAHNLNMNPSVLQLVQNSGSLPMVAKPLYGVLSDVLYVGGAHRLPYISIGVVLQVLSWGSLALVPVAGEALPILMACVLLSNLGASITEVAKDALVAEYGQKNKMNGLQSYAFMALAVGGMLGNFLGGFFMLKTQQPRSMFLIFASLLCLQLSMSLTTREESLGLPSSSKSVVGKSISESMRKQYSDLLVAISDESISRPLFWVVASIVMVPILSGSVFCYQTQCLNLDPSVIGMSRVVGQLMLLSMTVLYDRFWKNIPMRKLIGTLQILYASVLVLDLVLLKQVNLKLGIPNEIFVLCFSGVAEVIAQFKLLPFQILFASLAPAGCEGSLMSFLASAFCLSSIFSGFLGVGLASLLGIRSGDYSSLPMGIAIQVVAALAPLQWIKNLPMSVPSVEKEKRIGISKRKRLNRRVGRVVFNSVYAYRRERESEAQR